MSHDTSQCRDKERVSFKNTRGNGGRLHTENDGILEPNQGRPDIVEVERIIARDEVLQHRTNVYALLESMPRRKHQALYRIILQQKIGRTNRVGEGGLADEDESTVEFSDTGGELPSARMSSRTLGFGQGSESRWEAERTAQKAV